MRGTYDTEPTSRRYPSEEQASQQQPVKRSKKPKVTEKIAAHKLHTILEKAWTFQEIGLAVNTSEEESRDSQAAVKAGQLHALHDQLTTSKEESD